MIPKSVTTIEDVSFRSCHSLKSVEIQNSMAEVMDGAFEHCYNLESITLPNNMACIYGDTFKWCYSLKSIFIPASVTTIEESAFEDCDELVDIYYAGNKNQWGNITIENYNYSLQKATVHYNSNAIEVSLESYNIPMTESTKTISHVPNIMSLTSDNTQISDLTFVLLANVTCNNLTPNTTYNFHLIKADADQTKLDTSNLLYFNQYTTDDNGSFTASFSYPTELCRYFNKELSFSTTLTDSADIDLGDVNGDGSINAVDAADILREAAMIGAGLDGEFTEEQFNAADVNNDGMVNAVDAAIILRYAAMIGAGMDVTIEELVSG